MPLEVESFLSPEQVTQFRRALGDASWIDGAATAGHLSRHAKRNRQLPETHPVAVRLGNSILDLLEQHPLFMSYALPRQVVPPLFNAYSGGEEYEAHIDGAIRPVAGHSLRIRTDISATLFLSFPHEYEGGELAIEDADGKSQSYKLEAGTLLLYPSGSVHRVLPVTRGERLGSFFWVQSLVRSSEQRSMLFALDQIVQRLHHVVPGDPALVGMTGHYHNLLRLWADI
jgi:PKHD-type hydroxylase